MPDDLAPRLHEGQLPLTLAMVTQLVREQHPQWAHLPVVPVSTGTVNAVVRLGDELAARFPLVPDDADRARASLRAEADGHRRLGAATRFEVPEPVAEGEPGPGYPMPWAVHTWLPGTTADRDDPGASEGFAHDLADLVADTRAIGTGGATYAGEGRAGRGGHLPDHDDWVASCLAAGASDALLDVHALRGLWSRLRALPREHPDVTTHGDLMPGNLLVADGRLTGVLDCGGLGPADPALDLVGAWHLLESGPRDLLRRTLGCDDLTWARGAAWAFEQALGLVAYYADSLPGLSAIGRRTLDRVVADSPA